MSLEVWPPSATASHDREKSVCSSKVIVSAEVDAPGEWRTPVHNSRSVGGGLKLILQH